jgi:hypothetical protein
MNDQQVARMGMLERRIDLSHQEAFELFQLYELRDRAVGEDTDEADSEDEAQDTVVSHQIEVLVNRLDEIDLDEIRYTELGSRTEEAEAMDMQLLGSPFAGDYEHELEVERTPPTNRASAVRKQTFI